MPGAIPRRTTAYRRRRCASVGCSVRRAHLFEVAAVVPVLLLPAGQQHLALDGPKVIEEEDAVEVVHLMLDGARRERAHLEPERLAVRIERLDDDLLGTRDVGEHIGNGKASLLGGGAPLGREDPRIDERDPVAVGIDDRDSPRDAHLVRGESDALGGVHRLEHARDEFAHFGIDRPDLVAALSENRRTEEVKRKQRHHPADGCAVEAPIRTIRERSMTTVAVPDSTVTRVSFTPFVSTSLISRTRPMIPPAVITSSFFLSPESSSACFFRAAPWGRRMRK